MDGEVLVADLAVDLAAVRVDQAVLVDQAVKAVLVDLVDQVAHLQRLRHNSERLKEIFHHDDP